MGTSAWTIYTKDMDTRKNKSITGSVLALWSCFTIFFNSVASVMAILCPTATILRIQGESVSGPVQYSGWMNAIDAAMVFRFQAGQRAHDSDIQTRTINSDLCFSTVKAK
jgi:hypothetical protein